MTNIEVPNLDTKRVRPFFSSKAICLAQMQKLVCMLWMQEGEEGKSYKKKPAILEDIVTSICDIYSKEKLDNLQMLNQLIFPFSNKF